MSDLGPSCGYCQMNPCDHDGLWREYHDMERALREKDALVGRLVEALKRLTSIARSLWQMIDDSDIGHRVLRPATKEVIDQSAALLDALPKETP